MVALSGALMPGPLLTVTIAQTARRGFLASVLLVAGHSLLELILVVGLVSGLGHFLKLRPVTGTVAVLGGLMLLWMGVGMIRDARRGALDIPQTSEVQGQVSSSRFQVPSSRSQVEPETCNLKPETREHPTPRLIATGMAVSVSNPYWVIWWATVGLAGVTFFSALRQNVLGALGAFYVGHITGDIIWYLAVGAAISTGRRLLSARIYRGIVQVCALFLIFLGGSFLYLIATGGLWKIKMLTDWGT